MSALFTEDLVTPAAVLVASLVGSGHCAGMCGPLALQASSTRSALAAYHGGRLVAYLLLGAVAGSLGAALLPAPAGWVATALLAGYFLWAAYCLLRGRREPAFFPATFVVLVQRSLRCVVPRASDRWTAALATGALTGLLPCGWLHTFVIAAVATKSAAGGGMLLAFFWLGTVPALAVSSLLLRRITARWRSERSTVTAFLFVAAALGAVWVRAAPLRAASPAAASPAPATCSHGH